MTRTENAELKELNKKLDRVISKIDKMEVILTGNGTKGHEQRLEEVEEWIKTRPKECPAKPLSRGDIIKRRMLEVAIMSLIVSTAMTLIQLIMQRGGF